MMSTSYFRQGNKLLWENKLEEAIDAYRKAIEQNPNFYWGYHNVGKALEQLGSWEEAVEAYRQAIQLKPNANAACWSFLGLSRVLQKLGKVSDAQEAWKKAVKIEPKLSDFLNHGSTDFTSVQSIISSKKNANQLSNSQKQGQSVQVESEFPGKQSEIILFTPYYKAKHAERQNELIYCLKKNIECPEIDKIILLIDDKHQPEIEDPKLEIVDLSSRPTYLDWIELTEKKHPNQISVLANTDIYFDSSVSKLREIFSTNPNAFVTISRYEKKDSEEPSLHKNPHWSQDVWAICGQYHQFNNAFKNTLNIPLGVPRCDNKIAYLFAIRGVKVYNPCHYIKTIHVQKTESRNYDKKNDTSILGCVAYVHPSSNILNYSELDFQLWAIDFSQIKEVKLNKSLENWKKEQKQLNGEKSLISKDSQKQYYPKVDCILFPIIKKEIEDLIGYFYNLLLPTQEQGSLTFVISIDQFWEKKDIKRIQQAIAASKAYPCIKEVNFIDCKLTNFEAIYFRNIPKNVSKMNLPAYGLRTGPNLQFFRSMQQLLDSKKQYNSVLLQEVDTIPLKNFWLDFINKDIETRTDALLIGPTYSGVSQFSPEQINHLNGNAVYCLGNPWFRRFLQLWEHLVIEVCKKAPWKAYDSATEWAINYIKNNSYSLINENEYEHSSYFQSQQIQEYIKMYREQTYKLNAILHKAGPVELDPKTIFDPASITEELKSASILHLRPALPFQDLCRYISNEHKLSGTNVIGYDACWQYPAITEKHAYKMAKKYLQNYDDSIVYFGFPWATLIDYLLHNKPENAEYLLSILDKYKPYLKNFTKVVTVCQHAYMFDFEYLFNKVGVTDIFWCHATINQSNLSQFPEIKIFPFPLFPVQASDVSPRDFQGVYRKFLYCFVGTKSHSYYLTNSRDEIIKHLGSDERGIVRSRQDWYYRKIVYDYQIKKTVSSKDNLVNSSQSVEFKELLKQSVFSLCPSGSGPNSIRLWESIGYGAIPVVLSDTYLPPGDLNLWKSAVVTCPEKPDEIKALPDRLSALNQDKKLLKQKQNALQLLWDRYGVGCFVYDIIRLFDKYQKENGSSEVTV